MSSPSLVFLSTEESPISLPKTLTAEAGLISSPFETGVLPKNVKN